MASLTSILIWSSVVTVVLCVVWVFTARFIVLLVDRIITAHVAWLPVTPFTNDGRWFVFGKHHVLDLKTTDDQRFELPGWTDVPEADDELALALRRSVLSWPTFEFNFMTGHSPARRRYLYYLLVWTKANGATLKVVWRYEELFYAVDGWTGNASMRKGKTGIIYARVSTGSRPAK